MTSEGAANQVMYLGWQTSNSSGTALSTANVITEWELEVYSSDRVFEIPFQQMFANTTSQVFYAMTEWIPVTEVDKVRGLMDLAAVSNDFEAQFGYQLTNDPDDYPFTSTAFGSANDTVGKHYPTAFASPSKSTKLYIRFGYFIRVTSAGNGFGGLASVIEMMAN